MSAFQFKFFLRAFASTLEQATGTTPERGLISKPGQVQNEHLQEREETTRIQKQNDLSRRRGAAERNIHSPGALRLAGLPVHRSNMRKSTKTEWAAARALGGLVRALAATGIGVIGFALIPRYDAPFVGCSTSGLLALEPGCGIWPEMLQGALFVLPLALLTPRRWMLPLVATILLLSISLLGGLDLLRSGQGALYGQDFEIVERLAIGYPITLGGAIVLIGWGLYGRLRNRTP